jgi:hypothetical protein
LVSNQYIEVTYDANQVGWGVQIYTDNASIYGGDPTTNINQQPAGLIGEDNDLIACPLAVLVTPSLNDDSTKIDASDIETPLVDTDGTPGHEDYVVFFTSGYDQVTGGDPEKVWMWLKDKSGTKWLDKNSDGDIDLTGSYGDPDYEVVSDYSLGDDYATIVNTLGSSSGWADENTGVMQRDNAATSPLNVYVAADFSNANELQNYTTETLTLEIYHQEI